MKTMHYLFACLVILSVIANLPSPLIMADDFSFIPWLEGKEWTLVLNETRTAVGTESYSGTWTSFTNERATYVITSVSETQFTIAESGSTNRIVRATGTWVKRSSAACDNCTATVGGISYSGSFTVNRGSYEITSVSGAFSYVNIGHKLSELINPDGLDVGRQVSLWWINQYDEYVQVAYNIIGEQMLPVGGTTTRVLVVRHIGLSEGYWDSGRGVYSLGQLNRTYYIDESTGIRLAEHTEGNFSARLDDGSWQETLTLNSHIAENTLKFGAYVAFDSQRAAPIIVDNKTVEPSSEPKLFVWDWYSNHTVYVPGIYEVSPNTRLVFLGWDDGNNNTLRTIVANRPTELVANYKEQLLLNITSPCGNQTNSGWYDKGTTAQVHVDSACWLIFTFVGWSGDIESSNADLTVVMDNPKSLRANWRVDFDRVGAVILVIISVLVAMRVYHKTRRPVARTPFQRSRSGKKRRQPARSTKDRKILSKG